MPRVCFTAHLLRHLPCADGEVEASTAGEALEAIFQRHPAVRSYVLDEHGALRKHVVAFIDDRRMADRQRLSDPLGPHSTLHVLQALTGG